MKRILFILVAFSILNQSIDFDYQIQPGQFANTLSIGYDDIDSITEFLIETIMDDEHFTPESSDDDSGSPENKSVYKLDFNILYYSEQCVLLTPHPTKTSGIKRPSDMISDKTCKGYLHIVSPPPDASMA